MLPQLPRLLYRRLSEQEPAAVRQQLELISVEHKRQTRALIALCVLLGVLLFLELMHLVS